MTECDQFVKGSLLSFVKTNEDRLDSYIYFLFLKLKLQWAFFSIRSQLSYGTSFSSL